MLPFGVIKLENFITLHRSSTEPTRFGPTFGLHQFRGCSGSSPTCYGISPLPGSLSCQLHPQGNLAPRRDISNREHRLLEPSLTHRKQTAAPRSNRERSTNPFCGNHQVPIALPPSITGSPRASLANGSVCLSTFLPGSAQCVGCDVTHSKQKTATFLTGARTVHKCLQVSNAKRVDFRAAKIGSPRNPRA